MAKTRTSFVCRECGGVQTRWMGKCPDCGVWDALDQFREGPASGGARPADAWHAGHAPASSIEAKPLSQIESAATERWPTGLAEFDRVLGGGLVPGSAVLLGGDPGIGKSTLLLQACGQLARGGHRVLYVSSEESSYQTKLRAQRLFGGAGGESDLDELYVLAETDLARVVEQARVTRPRLMVIDSIQMTSTSAIDASSGSIAQLRRCCTELVCLAKSSGIAVLLVGHVTKDGQIAGPRLIEHLVDVVLSFEGDRHHAHRIVRGIKNRFGTTMEVGLFEMTAGGLEEVSDIAQLADLTTSPQPGTVICPVMAGSRSLCVEIQALTATGMLGSAKRRASGLDANRLSVLIAVLEKHAGLRLADQDVFVSTVGGLKVTEPACDLAVCLAIAAAHLRRPLEPATAVVGEVGLGGEVRRVSHFEQRVRESARLGYRTLIAPKQPSSGRDVRGCDIQAVQTVADAIETLASAAPRAIRTGAG